MAGNRRTQRKTGDPSRSRATQGKPLACKLLLGSLVLLLGSWAVLHFAPWYRQTTGDALSLLIPLATALPLAWKAVREPVTNLGKALLARLENEPRGWLVLLTANLFAAVLIATSNSVYVQLRQVESKGADPGEPRFRFAIHEDGKLWPAAEVSRDEPLFFRFVLAWPRGRRELSLDILKPDYKPVEKVLWPGLSARFKVPPSLEDLYVIRIVPGQELWPSLAPPSFSKPSRCNLHITVLPSDQAPIERTINLRQSLTYIGAGREEDLKAAAEEQPDSEWKSEFCRRMEEQPAPSCDEHLLLKEDARYAEVAIGKDDVVSFRLTCSSRDGRRRKAIQVEDPVKMAEPEVRTIYLPAPS